MIENRHHVPGRVRLRIRAIGREPALAARLVTALQAEQWVREVRANPACASIVIGYEPARLDAAELNTRLRRLLERTARRCINRTGQGARRCP